MPLSLKTLAPNKEGEAIMTITSGPTGLIGDVNKEELDAFVATLRGPVLTPAAPGYDEARVLFNTMHKASPGLIVQCAGTADVARAVQFAAQHDLLVATRGGGHSVAGNSTCEGGLVIDLSGLTGVFVNQEAKTVRVQGGATWGDLDHETQLHGFAVPGGMVSTTGVTGLTLGGGIGLLRRKFGLTCDSMLSVEIVTADGQVLTASEKENSDLFWALRGGGGSFGVVTSIEFQLRPVGPMVQAVVPFYPMEQAKEALPKWRDWVATLPDEVTTHAFMWTVPTDPPVMPPEIAGKDVFFTPTMYSGPVEEAGILEAAKSFGDPLFVITGPMPYAALQQAFDPFVGELGQHQCYWKSTFTNELSDEVIDIIIKRAQNRPDPWTLINVPAMGGAISRVDQDATAYLSRDAKFMISIDGMWHDEAKTEECKSWVRSMWEELQPHSTGGIYLNFLSEVDGSDGAATHQVYGKSWERLLQVKEKYDPKNLFHVSMDLSR